MSSFLHLPDRATLTESYTFSTVIFASFTLTEGRKQLLQTTKYKTSFDVTASSPAELGKLKSQAYSADYETKMPEWSKAALTDYASSPTNQINFPKGHGMIVGDDVLVTNITNGGNSVALAKVTSAGSYSIHISPDLSFEKGSLVAPYKIGVLSTNIGSSTTSGVQEKFAITFEEL